jgi:hypothetical protein
MIASHIDATMSSQSLTPQSNGTSASRSICIIVKPGMPTHLFSQALPTMLVLLVFIMAARAASLLHGSSAASRLDVSPVAPHDHGAGLRLYLLKEYKSGNMSAKSVCDIAYHALQGGGCAAVGNQHF